MKVTGREAAERLYRLGLHLYPQLNLSLTDNSSANSTYHIDSPFSKKDNHVFSCVISDTYIDEIYNVDDFAHKIESIKTVVDRLTTKSELRINFRHYTESLRYDFTVNKVVFNYEYDSRNGIEYFSTGNVFFERNGRTYNDFFKDVFKAYFTKQVDRLEKSVATTRNTINNTKHFLTIL